MKTTMLLTVAIVLAGTIIMAQPVYAQAGTAFESADTFAAACRTAVRSLDNSQGPATLKDAVNMFECIGYVHGYDDGISFAKSQLACTPETKTTDQLIKVFLKYVDAHPEFLHLDVASVLGAALHEAFPCKAGAVK